MELSQNVISDNMTYSKTFSICLNSFGADIDLIDLYALFVYACEYRSYLEFLFNEV